MIPDNSKEPSAEKVAEEIKKDEAELAAAREEAARAEAKEREVERKLEKDTEKLIEIERHRHYDLVVNRVQKTWPREEITGAEIKDLASSPKDWVVNQIIDGPGEDPEIGDAQRVKLAYEAEPKGEKRFTTRKPKTSPGA
jgi:hypothetical protein